jgi:hypothetical protein
VDNRLTTHLPPTSLELPLQQMELPKLPLGHRSTQAVPAPLRMVWGSEQTQTPLSFSSEPLGQHFLLLAISQSQMVTEKG